MDTLVVAALEEISLEGPSGCRLQKLWGALQGVASAMEIPLDTDAKQIVWQGLVNVPGLLLLPPNRTVVDIPLPASDPAYLNVEDVEKAGFYILAHEGLRDGCLGAYDLKYSDARLSDIQRGALERLAISRHEGVTQNELAKEFKKGGNAMFYVMRNLEVRGLLTRQSTIVRSKDTERNKHGSIVATNLVHLTRFAKNITLGSHQRFEILRPSSSNDPDAVPTLGDGAPDEGGVASKLKTYVINDDFPAMRAICEKIEQAAEKVLVVSDVKLTLGYRHAAGHRTWRRLVKRLQDAGLVEVFNAQIDRKVVTCIKLLKPFDAKAFNASHDDVECETSLRGGKRGQVTEQLTELPIDHQIYEHIDNAGFEGIHMMEVLKRLGLHNKRNYYRVTNMMARQVVISEAETHRRSTLYRLRTPKHAVATSMDKRSQRLADPSSSSHLPETPSAHECPEVNLADVASRTLSVAGKDKTEVQTEETIERSGNELAILEIGLQESGALASVDQQPMDPATETLTLSIQPPSRPGNQYPCFAASRTNAQREQRIYERLQAETFALRVELHRWLEEIEARKGIMMDRKTLSRVLQKMQSKGQCKIMKLSMPGLTNCGRKRESEVVLLPEVEVTPGLVKCLHERVRKFDAESRGQGVSRAKSLLNVPVLTGVVKRMNHRKKPVVLESIPVKGKSLQVNGFIPAKMVRVRMLHYYLWFYVKSLPESQNQVVQGKEDVASEGEAHLDDESSESSRSKIFALASAVHAMPLELYLQIIGSTKDVERVAERCKQGMRLCDIPAEELKTIVEHNSSGRLSWLVDVLCRLQLVQLKMGVGPIVRKKINLGRTLSAPEASLSYALELNPSLEEPASQAFPSFTSEIFSASPGEWHNFSLTSKEELDEYWQTLEYFYSGADPVTGKRHFPGSKVPEVFGLRSWTSLRIMSIEQRTELLKRVGAGGPETRKSAFECAKIAKDLNLSVEQVLRVSYEKNRRLRLIELAKAAAESDNLPGGSKGQNGLKQSSRKRTLVEIAASEPAHVQAYKRQRQLLLDALTSSAASCVAPRPRDDLEPGEDENQLFLDEKDEEEDDFEGSGPGETPASFMSGVVTLRPSRAKRFPWSERLDRILIVCYAKQRATLGARHQRVDWGSMPGLPAPPQACRRRMSQLRADPAVRKGVLKFCSLLATRYLEFLDGRRGKQGKEDDEEVDEPLAGCKNLGLVLSSESSLLKNAVGGSLEILDSEGKDCDEYTEDWNPMNDASVLLGLEEVMRCKIEAQAKRLAGSIGRGASKSKLATLQFESVQSLTSDNLPPLESSKLQAPSDALDCSLSPSPGSRITYDVGTTITMFSSTGTGKTRSTRTRARIRQVPSPSSLSKLSTDEIVQRSLHVANAVELIKLTMINFTDKREPESMIEALKRFRYGDIQRAFNYLRKHELVVSGHEGKPFVLSAKFHNDCSVSKFPCGSGEEAQITESWLRQRSTILQTEWVTLSPEQTCGQLLHLFGLVAAGEFVLAPFLPDEGIGESEDYTNMITGTKRKADSDGDQRCTKPKLQQYESHQYLSLRRERGYPGVRVAVHGASSSQSQDIVAFGSGIECGAGQASAVSQTSGADEDAIMICSDMTKHPGSAMVQHVAGLLPSDIHPTDSKEQLLEKCVEECSSSGITTSTVQRPGPRLEPALLESIFYAIEKANQEGVAMDELSEVMPSSGVCDGRHLDAEQVDAYVQALQSFNLVQKVNAFDHVRVVSAEHAAPFMLYVEVHSPTTELLTAGPSMEMELAEKISSNVDSEGVVSTINRNTDMTNSTHDLPNVTKRAIPMRPWLTEDGSMNMKFVKALTRRVMGNVTLSPGITEEQLVETMEVLNPQTAREFLHMLEADGHLLVRPRLQSQVATPPRLLKHLINVEAMESKSKLTRHYFPNPFDARLL